MKSSSLSRIQLMQGGIQFARLHTHTHIYIFPLNNAEEIERENNNQEIMMNKKRNSSRPAPSELESADD